MCGGKQTSTQTTTIPPEVLARYNAVNARAEDVAKQPFQRYTGQFVAPINQQQMAGISGINQAANMAQPYFNQASGALTNAYGQANPYYGQSLNTVAGGASQANQLYGTALGGISNAVNIGSQYGTDATRFINQAGTSAQPYMNQAGAYVGSGLAAADPLLAQSQKFLEGSTQAINPQEFGQAQINKYMSPYMKNVVEAQQALQQQESAAQRSALNSQAIGAGAFGGDRAGISQANLARQQTLANQATLSNLLQQGYGQAAGMFQQQQGVNLAAEQANRQAQQFGQQAAANLAQQRFGQNLAASQQYGNLGQALFGQNLSQGQALSALGQQLYGQGLGAAQAQAGIAQNQFGMSAQQANLMQQAAQGLFGMGSQYASGLAGLGTGAQAAALQGAQAQIGAGTLQQQTQQAEDTAKYQQFLQERGYDFQVAQFLANIAMGTGALSGSTTTTTSPGGFFSGLSDRRLKKNVKEIGETHDGLPIYSFKYKGGDDLPRIGVMADEAREKHPDAVHRINGVDSVDYEKIADRASEGGGVMPRHAGEGFAEGGHVSDQDLATILAMQKQFLGPHAEGGLYGQSTQNLPGGKGVVPLANLPVARLQRHSAPPQQSGGLRQGISELSQVSNLGEGLLGDKGILTKGGWPARAAQSAGLMPQQKPAETVKRQASSTSSAAPASKGPTAKQRGEVQDYSQPKQAAEMAPDAGGVMPRTNVAMSDAITPPSEDIFTPLTTVARGGVIPHKGGGGPLREGVLPYQAALKYGPEETNEAESGEQYSLLGSDKGGGKSGSGGSGLGTLSSLVSLGTTAAKAVPAAVEGLTALFAALPFSDERVKSDMERVGELDNGQPVYKYRIGNGPTQLGLSAQNVSKYGDPSAVHRDKDGFLHLDYDRATREYGGGIRPGYATDGSVEGEAQPEAETKRKSPLYDYYNYIVSKGEPEHVAAGMVGNIAKESAGNPEAWGDNDNSFGLFQKNVRGELPAFKQWAQENKRNMKDPYAQIDHALERLRGPYSSTYQQMLESNDPRKSAYLYATGYERPVPATANYEGRMAVAEQVRNGEYTGQGIVPSDGRKRSVAGAEYVRGSGQKGTTYVDGQPVEEPTSGLMPTNFRTGKPFTSVGDFLTDRQFIVPLLSGIGAMASSPSRYLGSAVLQGLGAAAQSYGGMEKTQQEISESKARELKDLASIPNSAMVTGPDGRLVGFRVYKNGKLDVVSVSEFYDALNRGQPYQIAPASRGEMETGTAAAGPSTSGGMGAEGGAGTKPSFEEPKAPTPLQPGQYRGVDPETNKFIGQRSRDVIQSNIKDLATNPANSPFASQQKAANVAQSGLQMRNQYGSALADMKFSNTGKFADEVKLPILRYFADTLAGLGVPKDAIPVDFEQLGQKQIVDKIRTSVAFTKDQEAQQKSFQSVLSQLEALPGVANNRDAAAALIADLYVTPQRDIELNKYYNDAKNIAVRQYKLPFDMSNYIGDGLADRFADQYNQQFSKDKKSIAQMYNERINVPDKDGNVKNYNVLSYLAKTGADIPPDVKAAIEKRYGSGITRYFSGK